MSFAFITIELKSDADMLNTIRLLKYLDEKKDDVIEEITFQVD